jgi:uncharacterized membrane protein YbhN (UPF0104 family)
VSGWDNAWVAGSEQAVPGAADGEIPKTERKSLCRRILSGIVSLAVIVALFAFVVPKVSGASLADAVAYITPGALAVTLLAGLVNLFTNWPPIVVSLPGLRLPQAGVANVTAAAVSNTVPEGGAIATGLTYSIFHSWGLGVRAVTVSILTTGVWTNLVRYSLFAISLFVVAVGSANAARGVLGSFVVVVIMAAVVVVFSRVLRSEQLATRVGRALGHVINPIRRLLHRDPADLVGVVMRFRNDLSGLVQDRWRRLTGWMVLSQASAAMVLVVALRSVGIGNDEVGLALAFVAYTGAVVLSLVIPVPGGVGVAETAYIAILTPFVGADQSAQLFAAVVMFRIATWFLPIPLGAGGYLFWRYYRPWRRPSLGADQEVGHGA